MSSIRSSTGSAGYPPARPGAGPPAPTRTTGVEAAGSYHSPSLPQPGATPVPLSTITTTKPIIPPPPKAGEALRPPGYYLPAQATPPTNSGNPQPYPPQMALPIPIASIGQPPASTTSTNLTPSYGPTNPQTSHPPGYVQNPHASEIAPTQRFVTNQSNQSGGSQPLKYVESGTINAGYEIEEGVWGMAKRWAQGLGNYVTDINEKVSRNLK